MPDLVYLGSTYIDVYMADVPLKAVNDHPPIRATRVVVELEGAHDTTGSGKAKVHISITGERIVALPGGTFTTANTGSGQVFGLLEEQNRYELCRQAILTSLAKHRMTPADLVAFPFEQDWHDHVRTMAVGAVNLGGAVSRYLQHPGQDDVEDDRF